MSAMRSICVSVCWIWAVMVALTPRAQAEVPAFSVATYNLENYLEAPAGTRPAKSAQGKTKVQEGILSLKADVLVLQELGGGEALAELRKALAARCLDYPHCEQVWGADKAISLAVLSRFPILARRSHTNEQFLLDGRRFRVARGFVELDLEVTPRYRFTLLAAHLKSRLSNPTADEAEIREQEAALLRARIESYLAADPAVNLIVLGDFNDTKDSRTLRTILGRGRAGLVDTRPAEREGAPSGGSPTAPGSQGVAWTHHYAKTDAYQRLDYILASPGMAREWDPARTFALAWPDWHLASDHRPILATFFAEDR